MPGSLRRTRECRTAVKEGTAQRMEAARATQAVGTPTTATTWRKGMPGTMRTVPVQARGTMEPAQQA